MLQVPPEHYEQSAYDELHRWLSYWYQLRSVRATGAQTVLEIGKGTGVLSWYMRERSKIDVVTLDFDASLEPDVVGDIRAVDQLFDADQFDAVCAFQVLEHLPFEDFAPTLKKMSRISKRDVLISLPNWGYFLQFRFHLWRFKYAFGRKLRRPFTWRFDGEHHWEVGTRGYSPKKVRQTIETVLRIKEELVYPDYPYHVGYWLTKT